jgi:hypothetical protein
LAAALHADPADDLNLTLPSAGDHTLHILAPTILELKRINAKDPDPARVDSWDFFDGSNQFVAPATSQFVVTVGGSPAAVTALGFKRRPLYAPDRRRDLRIENDLYLQLAAPIADGQTVTVTNPGALIFPGSEVYTATADPLRFSPAIHVNQEGYVPGLPKKAMIGYYLGNLGELDVSTSLGFKIVDASTGAVVFTGALTSRPDVGYLYSPTPYQSVLEADFSALTTPGTYKLQVPGLGASLPFVIDEGIAMGFLRTYALGLYHQRCGTTNALPFTRFVHDACHTAPVEIPTPEANFSFTWSTIATKNADYASNPRHTAPQLVSEATQLYPFVNTGSIDVTGGHHDAGDYSKYTINSAALVHRLMFIVDALPGAAALDNLGLPESGDGISDILQEAKIEADFLAKMQDADGGFYFLVYPKNREYELDVLPDHGDAQVVWPKNTAATAAAVAALAQCASSPAFKAAYPSVATAYLQKAQLGWQFLTDAIAIHGKDGAYQKITFYGDTYMHDDELAWAACEMFLATGDTQYRDKLFAWFPDPSDPNTFRFGWWRMSESWGNAIRSYAFAARTSRLLASQLDSAYLAACEAQIVAAGDDALQWSADNAYATSFPDQTKAFNTAGFYFSLDQASDMAVAYQIDPKPAYLDALLGNLNYEAGTNPVNVSYLTGRGQKRQREIVDQFAQNDRRVLPPDGIPLGNIQSGFAFLSLYGTELGSLVFPIDGALTAPFPFYDRWGDSYNVTTEFIAVNQARALTSLVVLATQTSATAQPWQSATAQIVVPSGTAPLNAPATLTLQTPGLDLTHARIVWEARDQEPAFGSSYTISPKNNGTQWAEAEIEWPDGRRVFATNTFFASSPSVRWINGAVPAGATPVTGGGDAWTWVTNNPAPRTASAAHQSNLTSGIHFHAFVDATGTMEVNTGDILFAWVYLDPANPPSEVMLTWSDGSDEHRAYWGTNHIAWGIDGTASQLPMGALPPTGRWVRLEVPTSAVNLEGSTVKGMGFVLYDGRATFDTAGLRMPDFAAWQQEEFTSAELADANISGPDAILGVDGLSNAAKYALGLEAAQNAVAPLPLLDFTGSEWQENFTRPANRSDVTLVLEISSDLVNWTSSGVTLERLAATPRETWRAHYPFNSAGKIFSRHKIAVVGAQAVNLVPTGALQFAINAGSVVTPVTTPLAIPLTGTPEIAGAPLGRVSSVTSSAITVSGANWIAGALSMPALPHAFRFVTGPAAGLTFMITANTSDTVSTSGIDLTQYGIGAGSGGDIVRIVPVDTLNTLFGAGMFLGGASASEADIVTLGGTVQLSYYYNTSLGRWVRTTGPTTDRGNTPIPAKAEISITRKAAACTLTISGRVPDVPFAELVANSGSTFTHAGFPTDTTLGELSLQTALAGWVSNPTAANADTLSIANGAGWISYFHNGTHWQRTTGPATNRDGIVLPAGTPILIFKRGSASGSSLLRRALPYTP